MNQSKSLQKAHAEYTRMLYTPGILLSSALEYVCRKHGVDKERLLRYKQPVRVRKSNTHLRR